MKKTVNWKERRELMREANRFSRQTASGVGNLSKMKVLIYGMQGAGIEVAKNLALMGVGHLTLIDESPTQMSDLGLNFFLREEDVGKGRAVCVLPRLQKLNKDCKMVVETYFSDELVSKISDEGGRFYSAVIITSPLPLSRLVQLNELCRSPFSPGRRGSGDRGDVIAFFYGFSASVYGHVFSDLSANHIVNDRDGDRPVIRVPCKVSRVFKIEHTPDEPTTSGNDTLLIGFKRPDGDTTQKELDFDYCNPNQYITISELEGELAALNGAHKILQADKVDELEYIDGKKENAYVTVKFISIACPPGFTFRGSPYVPINGRYQKDNVTDNVYHEMRINEGLVTELKRDEDWPMKSLAEKIKSLGDPFGNFPDDTTNTSYGEVEGKLHVCFAAYHSFIDQVGRIPAVYNDEDAQAVLAIAKSLSSEGTIDGTLDEEYVLKYCRTASSELQPMSAFLGGVIAQEVTKLTRKRVPISGFMHFSTSESLPKVIPSEEERTPKGSRYDKLASIYGWPFVEKLNDLNYFMVGCGALGCENLKNFALNGICCGENGCLTITDGDRIELSNLSRQFLFREHNVTQPKSKAGAAMAQQMNKDFKIKSLQQFAGPKTEDIFNDDFWMGLDGVCNALDNVEARLYIDNQCVKWSKSLLESSTTGTKGNVDSIVPFKTKKYAEMGNVGEDGDVPFCTLKNYPHLTDHCIEWALSEFQLYFKSLSGDCERYLSNPQKFEEDNRNAAQKGDAITKTRILLSYLKAFNSHSLEGCVGFAYDLFHFLFRDRIKDLQANDPEDKRIIDDDGKDCGPFWGGKRRYPTAAVFDIENRHHVHFVSVTALLLAINFKITPKRPSEGSKEEEDWLLEFRGQFYENEVSDQHVLPSYEWCKSIIKSLKEVPYLSAPVDAEDKNTKKATEADPKEAERKAALEEIFGNLFTSLNDARAATATRTHISGSDSASGGGVGGSSSLSLNIDKQDFEKDDDLNFHIDFITSCANLRCDNYRLARTNFNSCKVKAGKIIPALATTTASVCGLVMFEMLKIQMNLDTEDYRNRTIDIGNNTYASSEATKPTLFKTKVNKETKEKSIAYPEGHSCWDCIRIPGSLTIRQFAQICSGVMKLKLDALDVILGTRKSKKDGKDKTVNKSVRVFPALDPIDTKLLPSLELTENQAKIAIMKNAAIKAKPRYSQYWKDCKAVGRFIDNNDSFSMDMTLKDMCLLIQRHADEAEKTLIFDEELKAEVKEIDSKFFSLMDERKVVFFNSSNAEFTLVDNTTGSSVGNMVSVAVEL